MEQPVEPAKQRQRWILAGQLPPPVHGQNLSIAQALQDLARFPDVRVEHLPFNFSRSLDEIRKPGLHKILGLLCVYWRLTCLRLTGPIDLLIFPAGGPHKVPLWRDICLLPLCLILSRKVVIRFYAAGLESVIHQLDALTIRLVRSLYRRCAGMVMTEYGRRDARAVGITDVQVVPHALDDTFLPEMVTEFRDPEGLSLLYVGHLCPDKGTPALLEAFSHLRKMHPRLTLTLVGEPSAPYTAAQLQETLQRLEISDSVTVTGVLHGEAKWRAFAAANCFVFPSRAAFESFGRVMVEAMMWELPVVATDWRGNAEVTGDCGWLVPDNMASPIRALIQTLATAIEERDDWTDRGKRARERYLREFASSSHPNRLHDALYHLSRPREP